MIRLGYNVDREVVEMRFDNSNFQRNIDKSINSIHELNQGLQFKGVAQGIGSVNNAIANINFNPIAKGIDSVKRSFSVMETIATGALLNIGYRVSNLATKVIKEFTITPISTGFNEYELKMNSVQTIMASTGESIEKVNSYLNELNKYSDQTIYSFQDMTSNIGKFTNAGVSLDKAVLAIKGISNEAALSGANANEASRAMYNFAQALSAGYVKLIDWKSIENANMATVQFKNELIKTAVELGTIKKKGDSYITTTTNMNGKVSEAFNATKLFNESLANQWMTTDVLVETLRRYADATTEIGQKAYAAAQDVKTFSMMMDTLKEAAQSGWAESWETIIGNLEQAKHFWTTLADMLSEIIGGMDDARNTLLHQTLDSPSDLFLGKLADSGVNIKEFEENIVNTYKRLYASQEAYDKGINKFNYDIETQTSDLDKHLNDLGLEATFIQDIFPTLTDLEVGETFDEWVSNLEKLDKEEKEAAGITDDYIATLKELRDFEAFINLDESNAEGKTAIKNYKDINAHKFENSEYGYQGMKYHNDELNKDFDFISVLGSWENSHTDANKRGGRELLQDSIYNIIKAIKKLGETVHAAWREIFPAISSNKLFSFVEKFHDFSEYLIMTDDAADKLKKTLQLFIRPLKILSDIAKVIFNVVKRFAPVFDAVINGILDVGEAISDFLLPIIDSLFNFENLDDFFGRIADAATNLATGISSIFSALTPAEDAAAKAQGVFTGFFDAIRTSIDKVLPIFTPFWDALKIIFDGILERVKNLDGHDIITFLNEGILAKVLLSLKDVFKKLGNFLEKGNVSKLTESISQIFTTIGDTAEVMQRKVSADVLMTIAKSLLMISGAFLLLSTIDIDHLIASGIALGAMFVLLKKVAWELTTITKPLSTEMKKTGRAINGAVLGMQLIALSTSILILATAIKLISTIESPEAIFNAVGAIAALLAMLWAFTEAVENLHIKLSKTENPLADKEKAKAFSKTTTALLKLGASILILSAAIKIFSGMTTEELTKGITAFGAILVLLWAFVEFVKSNKEHLLALGSSIFMISLAMVALSGALMVLSKIDTDSLAAGIIAIFVSLVAFAAALRMIDPKGVIAKGAAILMLSLAVDALALGLGMIAKIVASEGAEGLFAAVLTMAGSLFILGTALFLLGDPKVIFGALALGLLALSLNALIPPLMLFAKLDWDEIGKALLTLGGALAVIVIAAAAVTFIPGLIAGLVAMSLSMLALGLGLTLVGTGALLVADAIEVLADTIMKVVDWIVDGVKVLLEALTGLITGILGIINNEETKAQYRQAGKDLGMDMSEGIAEGLDNGTGEIGAAASRLGQRIVTEVNKELGIASPSKAFSKIGQYCAAGLSLGFSKSFKQVEDGVLTSIRQMKSKGITEAMNNVISTMESDNFQPVIKPEFDDTNIVDGLKNMNSMFDNNPAVSLGGMIESQIQNGVDSGINSATGSQMTFVQNNYSPKALSNIEIYRQTKNQLAMAKGVISNT